MADDETVKNEAVADTPATQAKGIFVPLIFGGAVATALGFFAAQLDSVEQALGWADDDQLEVLIAEQSDQIEAQAAMIAALSEQVDALPDTVPEVDLSDIEAVLTEQRDALSGTIARIETLEKRPMTEAVSEEALAAYQAELARLQGSAEEQRQQIEGLLETAEIEFNDLKDSVEALLSEAQQSRDDAQERAQMALARAAMAKIIAAVDTGEPFAASASEVAETGSASLPEVLVANAGDGVPTLAEVQADFSEIARTALRAARSEAAASGESGGIGSFLQRQLGARSVAPKEGDDPDAVLSRAEAAVQSGAIGEALDEVSKLPPAAQEAISGWVDIARTRHQAVTAANELMTTLSTN